MFATGMILFLISLVLLGYSKTGTKLENFGFSLSFVGFVFMFASLTTSAWRYLP